MSNSILADIQGPDWPLGSVAVATPGTPVGLMSVADPTSKWAPGTAVDPLVGLPGYTVRGYRLVMYGYKNSGTTWVANTGNVYLLRKGSGSSNRSDSGVLVEVIPTAGRVVIEGVSLVKDWCSPYRYFVDADTAADALTAVLWIF